MRTRAGRIGAQALPQILGHVQSCRVAFRSAFRQGLEADPLEPVVEAEELVRLRSLVPHIHCEPSVRRYLVAIIRATRKHAALELGASPRASLALFRASRALAAISGRDYVLPDDIKRLAPVVLPHRLILGSQSRLRGRDAGDVLDEVLAEVPAPVEG